MAELDRLELKGREEETQFPSVSGAFYHHLDVFLPSLQQPQLMSKLNKDDTPLLPLIIQP